jgi:hypothetical protein
MQINLQNWTPILVYGLTPILLCCASNLEQLSHCIIPGCVRECGEGGEYNVFRIKDIAGIGVPNVMNCLPL